MSSRRPELAGSRSGRRRRASWAAPALALVGALLAGCLRPDGLARVPAAATIRTPTALALAAPTAAPAAAALPTATRAPAQPAIGAAGAASLSIIARLEGHTATVTDLAFSPDSAWLASASADESLRLWPASGAASRRLEGHGDVVWSLAFSPDGSRLISGSDDRTVRVWSIPQGALLDTIGSASFGRALRVAYSPDGLWLAAADQFCLIQVRSARTGVLYRSLLQPGCGVAAGSVVNTWGLVFDPDGRHLLSAEARTCCGGSVRSWDLESYDPPARIQGPNGGVRAMALSPDASALAVAFASSAVPWLVQADDGAVLHQLVGHGYAVRDLDISPDGRLLATASSDHTIRLWDLESGQLLATLEGHEAGVESVAFSADGIRLASGDAQGMILLWGIE